MVGVDNGRCVALGVETSQNAPIKKIVTYVNQLDGGLWKPGKYLWPSLYCHDLCFVDQAGARWVETRVLILPTFWTFQFGQVVNMRTGKLRVYLIPCIILPWLGNCPSNGSNISDNRRLEQKDFKLSHRLDPAFSIGISRKKCVGFDCPIFWRRVKSSEHLVVLVGTVDWTGNRHFSKPFLAAKAAWNPATLHPPRNIFAYCLQMIVRY